MTIKIDGKGSNLHREKRIDAFISIGSLIVLLLLCVLLMASCKPAPTPFDQAMYDFDYTEEGEQP